MIEHVCEVCGRTETLDSNEAYLAGWDYPPFMGIWGVLSPRTCPDCSIDQSAWFALMMLKTPNDKLSDKHKETIIRIANEEAPEP